LEEADWETLNLELVIQAAWGGLELIFSWPNILYPIAGTLLAMCFATIPGISGVTLMALAIPLTISWEPVPILLLFGSFVGGGTFMGSVTAILVNIPGTGPSAATMFDGYPMTRRGQAKTALACSATASALGSSFGVLLLILLLPVMPWAILAFGPPEFLLLAIWGLTTVAVLGRTGVLKGLGMAGVGLLVSFVGFDPRTAESRYAFGSLYLHDGLSLVAVFLGIFAVAETIDLAASGRKTISGKTRVEDLTGSAWEGIMSVFRNFGLFIRSSIIGSLVGIVPGIGGTVASFVAYGHAAQTARDGRESFGRGDIRGVLAPEAANDAKDGGSLIPTLAFGVPGSAGTALLLSVLILHGIIPGEELMSDGLPFVFALIWSLFLSNWLSSIVGLGVVDRIARFTLVRTQRLVPWILFFAVFGAFAHRGRFGDVVLALLCGIVGFFMKKHDWPRIALVIALVLGPLFEINLHMTIRMQQLGRIMLWTRPMTVVLLAVILASLVVPYLRGRGRNIDAVSR
jgi:TctA family transporter